MTLPTYDTLNKTMAATIKQFRLQRGFTQERLAGMVGVSVPAVSKWETGSSVPDIALLSPLARALGTSPDELLNFRQELTEEETARLMQQVKDCCEKDGFESGMALAKSLVQEYPSSERLKLKAANAAMMYAYTIPADYTDEEYEKVQAVSLQWFEELAKEAAREEIKTAASFALISSYICMERLEEAEQLIEAIPCQDYDARRMKPTLYYLKGENQKAVETAQQFLLKDIQNVRNAILSLYTVSMKEKDYDKALAYAMEFECLGREYSKRLGGGAEYVLRVYLAKEDRENALDWFRRYVDEIMQLPASFADTIYFDAIAGRIEEAQTVQGKATVENLQQGLYKTILMNPMYEKLKDYAEFQENMARLKAFMEQSGGVQEETSETHY